MNKDLDTMNFKNNNDNNNNPKAQRELQNIIIFF